MSDLSDESIAASTADRRDQVRDMRNSGLTNPQIAVRLQEPIHVINNDVAWLRKKGFLEKFNAKNKKAAKRRMLNKVKKQPGSDILDINFGENLAPHKVLVALALGYKVKSAGGIEYKRDGDRIVYCDLFNDKVWLPATIHALNNFVASGVPDEIDY